MGCTFHDTAPLQERAGVVRSEDAVEFARRRLGFEADEKQKEVLRWKSKRVLLACTRQWGKSTAAAAKAVHRAHTEKGSLVLVASPGERQSAEFLRKTGDFVRRMGIRVRGDGDNELSILFPNGSRIVGLPGVQATVRGFSAVSMLLIDEAAQVEDVMYKALRPMLAVTAGDVWLMSTPYGQRGFFYEAWKNGGDAWARMAVTALDCPRIDRAFLEEERMVHGNSWFRQEYLCEFVDDGTGVFDREVVERAVADWVEALRL